MDQSPVHISWMQKAIPKLQNEWVKEAFLHKIIAQINKDFNGFEQLDPNFNIPEEAVAQIVNRLTQTLENIDKTQPEALKQLLYRIDLPEEITQSIFQNATSVYSDLAHCIFIREAYKILIRDSFSNPRENPI